MNLANVIMFKYPGAQFMLHGNEYEGLSWLDEEIDKPSLQEIELASVEFDHHLLNTDYLKQRKGAYPSIVDQLDLIYHNGIDEWAEHILNVKKKYPNPAKPIKERAVMNTPSTQEQIAELNAKIETLEKKTAAAIHSHHVDVGDIKNGMFAIKGFMMEIPNIKKTLEEIQSQLNKD